ncbi:hypothetical protein ACFE04_003442 [Oxalis oulophora]
MAKLKVAGTWSGVLEPIDLENWTVAMLRKEVADRSNTNPDSIKLICGGRVLKDGDGSEKLTKLGVKNNAKILSSRVAADEGKALYDQMLAEEERSSRITRLKAAAEAVAKRNTDGSLPISDFNLELENQSGETVELGSETDQQALMMGLMFHENGKALIKKQKFKDALEVLLMGEEAFLLCNPKIIEFIDNVAILQIDMVWCYFMLQDISWLSVAGVRLEKARKGLERAHGKDFSRVRLLQPACTPELALHLRLELLDGVIAYHSGQLDKCRKSLNSAQEKFSKLEVTDESLTLVMSMGFREHEAKRGLRMSNQDVGNAVNFLVEEREKQALREQEDIQKRDEITEQKSYGVTPLKKAVDMKKVNYFFSIGFEKELAAEALRRNENHTQNALDDLTNPETNSTIQLHLETRKRKREQKATDKTVDKLVSMGFERDRAIEAVAVGGSFEEMTNRLLVSGLNPTATDDNGASSNVPEDNNANLADDPAPDDELADDSSDEDKTEDRDVEMENELYKKIDDADAMSDYDIDVTREGEAIKEYLALLESSNSSEQASTSS